MPFRDPQYLHPLVAAAAVSLILASVVGVAKLTGLFEPAPALEHSALLVDTPVAVTTSGMGTAGETVSGAPMPLSAVNTSTVDSEPKLIPSVYVHVLGEAARRRMIELAPAMEKNGIALAGIKVVSIAPARSDLRYFRSNEHAEAQMVQAKLISLGLPAQRLKRINGMESMAKRRQYELWLSDS